MNATNRIMNRLVLLLIGSLLGAIGAAALLVSIRPPWARAALDQAMGRVDEMTSWLFSTASLGGVRDFPLAAVIAITALLAAAVLLIVFVATRGGGASRTVLRSEQTDGVTSVDVAVADAVIAGALRERVDVLAARTSAHRMRGQTALRVAVTAPRGVDLASVAAAAERALTTWDALAGTRIPVILHLADRGWRDGLRSAVRVH